MKYKLIDLLDFKTQGVNTTTDHISYVEKGYKIVQAKNIAPYNITFDESNFVDEETFSRIKDNHKLHKGEVLYTNIGSQLGNSAIYEFDDEAIITWNVMKLIPNKDIIDNYYLCYLLNSNKPYIKALNTSSTMPFVSGKALMNVEFEVPDLQTQKKVIKVLKNIEDKIKLDNEINNNLYEFNNKLFEEKILNNAEKDDWEEYLLSDISKMINGYSYKGNELVEKSNIGMATIKNFERTGGFKLDGFKDIVPQKCKSDHYVKPFEILVACTDLTQNADIIGNAIMLLNNANYDEIIMSMDLVKLIPITDIINNYMLYAIVNSKDFKNFALRYKSGTTVLHLNKNCFKEYTIKLPNYNTIKDLSKVFEGNYKKISQIVDENRKLEQLRDTLLPKLMNGEIDLDNIEI